jgi:hypothetical protein
MFLPPMNFEGDAVSGNDATRKVLLSILGRNHSLLGLPRGAQRDEKLTRELTLPYCWRPVLDPEHSAGANSAERKVVSKVIPTREVGCGG